MPDLPPPIRVPGAPAWCNVNDFLRNAKESRETCGVRCVLCQNPTLDIKGISEMANRNLEATLPWNPRIENHEPPIVLGGDADATTLLSDDDEDDDLIVVRKVTVTAQRSGDEHDEPVLPDLDSDDKFIMLGRTEDEPAVLLWCNHIFGLRCVYENFRRQEAHGLPLSCPTCASAMSCEACGFLLAAKRLPGRASPVGPGWVTNVKLPQGTPPRACAACQARRRARINRSAVDRLAGTKLPVDDFEVLASEACGGLEQDAPWIFIETEAELSRLPRVKDVWPADVGRRSKRQQACVDRFMNVRHRQQVTAQRLAARNPWLRVDSGQVFPRALRTAATGGGAGREGAFRSGGNREAAQPEGCDYY